MRGIIITALIALAVAVSYADNTGKQIKALHDEVAEARDTADEAHQKAMELEDKVDDLETRLSEVESNQD